MTDHVSSRFLSGLCYEPGKKESLEETRRGAPIYDGTPDCYEEYKPRVEEKPHAAEQAEEENKFYKHAELAGQLFDGLKEEALRVAMDIGQFIVCELGGIKKPLAAIKTNHLLTSGRRC